VLIVQISDMHVLRKGVLAFGKLDTHGHMERCIAAIKALTPAPDFVRVFSRSTGARTGWSPTSSRSATFHPRAASAMRLRERRSI
jgi:hypothetical protein